MKRVILFSVVVSLLIGIFLQSGCTQQIRYSENEIKGYPAKTQEYIRKGEIAPGMTPEQVRYAWGNPDSQKILEPFEGKTREEWIYAKMGVLGTKILLFYEGKLIYVK